MDIVLSTNTLRSCGPGLIGLFPGRAMIGPLILLMFAPCFIFAILHANTKLGGSVVALLSAMVQKGFLGFYSSAIPSPFNPTAWKILLSYMAFELALMRLVPGKQFRSTETATGHVPVYTANGVQCYLISIATWFSLTYFGVINPGVVYDLFGDLVSSVNLFSLIFCLFLYIKGLTAPSTKDCGSSGNFIIDYFWGTELYPRILGWDVKVFTNCRFGMMYWQLGLLCYAYKQYTDIGYVSSSMFVCVALQTIYIAKFYWWETGYFCSMDIQHDRAGYYICYGCLVYLPVVYTSQAFYLVKHPVNLSPVVTVIMLALGMLFIWMNYDADRQRQFFRSSNGRCRIWGREPEYIEAEYTSETGEARKSLLLCDGWWALSRHWHYIPEILASFMWSVPALFDHGMPYLYVIYLTILLTDRAYRDDARCSAKYGKSWDTYKKKVPAYIIPGVL